MPLQAEDALPSLSTVLSNHLILLEICPLLPISSLLSLSATSKLFSYLLYNTPNTFRHLNLSTRSGKPSTIDFEFLNERRRQAGPIETTLDQYNAMPLRCIFDVLKKNLVLDDVTTLILDGLCVSNAMFSEILCLERDNIRLLSIRNVTSLRKDTIRKVLKDITRPSRPLGTPKLTGLYCFNADASRDNFRILSKSRSGITATMGARFGCQSFDEAAHASAAIVPWHSDDGWYDGNGQVLDDLSNNGMGQYLLQECAGIISFDAVFCRRCPKSILSGNWSETYARPRVATVSLRGCESCHNAPEGSAIVGKSPSDHLPLLSPPPLHTSTVRAAQTPATYGHIPPPLYARCSRCIMDRRCNGCNAWWCESCYILPEPKPKAYEGPYSVMVSLASMLRIVFWESYSMRRQGWVHSVFWQVPKSLYGSFPFRIPLWVSRSEYAIRSDCLPLQQWVFTSGLVHCFSFNMLFKSANG